MSRFKLPVYQPTKLSKTWVYQNMGVAAKTIALLEVDAVTYRNWGRFVPAPYADRLWLSEWGLKRVVPRFVPVEDALIIFKDFNLMAHHFGKKKFWQSETMFFLPELASAYMIRHFSKFMRVYTLDEIEKRNYR